MQQQFNNNTQTDEDSYLKNLLPRNEHVGVDEECMHLTNEPAGAENVLIYVAEEQQHDKSAVDDGSYSDKSEEEEEEEEEEREEMSKRM
jgi:gamma-glutamylcyclotransferase (GGCT)/AIG2-like uncharacterized protein YtfP